MKVKIKDIVFDSMTDASKFIKCSVATVSNRCKSSKFPDYELIQPDEKSVETIYVGSSDSKREEK